MIWNLNHVYPGTDNVHEVVTKTTIFMIGLAATWDCNLLCSDFFCCPLAIFTSKKCNSATKEEVGTATRPHSLLADSAALATTMISNRIVPVLYAYVCRLIRLRFCDRDPWLSLHTLHKRTLPPFKAWHGCHIYTCKTSITKWASWIYKRSDCVVAAPAGLYYLVCVLPAITTLLWVGLFLWEWYPHDRTWPQESVSPMVDYDESICNHVSP